jgi:hypothetical protein
MFSRQVSHLSAIAAVVGGLSLGTSRAAAEDAKPLERLTSPRVEKATVISTNKLETLRQVAEQQRSPEAERAYLAAFPHSFAAFKETFASSGPTSLEPKYIDHMTMLEKLAAKHQAEVVSIWLDTSVGASWDADAIGMLQDQVTRFAATDPGGFGAALSKRSPADQKSIVRFLADVENPDVNHDYQRAIIGLRNRKFDALAYEFEDAQAQRERAVNH